MMFRHMQQGRWFVGLSFLFAFVLSIFPLPQWAIALRPEWVLLVVLYWILFLPEVMPLSKIFLVGLFLDLLQGTLLGEHALALIIVAYFVCKFRLIIRVYPVLQQTLMIFWLLLVYKTVIFILQGFIGHLPAAWTYWGSLITSVVLWPWISALLHDFQIKLPVI